MSDTAHLSLQVGSVLGRYELLLPIAKGGMAQVWAARLRGSRGFQKLVAVKTILPDVMDNTRMERMFMEEAQLASQIHHPNVVQTLELGEHEGTLYLVLEWVDGEPLHRVMSQASERGGLPLPIAVNLIGQACEGLQAAHDLRDEGGALLGVVHRDVSPQNLLVSFSGLAKLVDFGIAKVTAKSSGLTQAGEVKGKFAYMAPEQVRGQPIDARTDLFSLGIVLYAITTGKHPFRGAHPGETLQNICSPAPAPPPSSFVSDYPRELEEIVLKALAKQPEQRFESARAMLTALHAALPSALSPGFEAQVADFMRELFRAQSLERRAAIRSAQQNLDRQRNEGSVSSIGTLRAISISQAESGNASLAPTPQPAPLPPPRELELPALRNHRLIALGAAAALVVTVAAFLALRRAPETLDPKLASSPVAGESLESVARPPASTVAPSFAPPPVAVVAPSAVPSAASAPNEEPRRRSSRLARGATATSPQSAAAGTGNVPPASAPSAPAPPARPERAEPPPSVSTNAWDRDAFGGRH